MIYYIGDTHFGHRNIIKYDNRPFFTVSEMDEELIKRWNAKVTDDDTVYILGDFSWYDNDKSIEILNRLNGKKILIRGNHDTHSPLFTEAFANVYDYAKIKDDGRWVVLSHYPMPFYDGMYGNDIHLYAHVHVTRDWVEFEGFVDRLRKEYKLTVPAINVGCMMPWMDYTPRTLDEIIAGEAKYRERIRVF